jgi:hypothetical protein
MQAATYWQQWEVINGLLNDQQQPDQQRATANSSVQWQHPPTGLLKCNVDASFFSSNGATGWGWCLHDSRGYFQLAGTNVVNSPLSVLEGEALAIIEAMKEVIHRGLPFVIFESDSKLVVNVISSRQNGTSEFSILLSHIHSLLIMHNTLRLSM